MICICCGEPLSIAEINAMAEAMEITPAQLLAFTTTQCQEADIMCDLCAEG